MSAECINKLCPAFQFLPMSLPSLTACSVPQIHSACHALSFPRTNSSYRQLHQVWNPRTLIRTLPNLALPYQIDTLQPRPVGKLPPSDQVSCLALHVPHEFQPVLLPIHRGPFHTLLQMVLSPSFESGRWGNAVFEKKSPSLYLKNL